MRLAGKVAIITGAAGGMGEASALLFAREGASVAVVDLSLEAATPVVEQITAAGGQAIAVAADVTRSEDVQRIVARTMEALGPPTVLFNNAGIDTEGRRSVIDIPEEVFDRTLEVNLKGPWLMIKFVAPKMIEAGGGSIINTASVGGFIAASTAGYCASKAGVIALTRVAAVDLGRYNIRVNALCPGATVTPAAARQHAAMVAAGRPGGSPVERISALGRLADPSEMAKMALFLASDESSFATGAPFINDGGWTSLSGVAARS